MDEKESAKKVIPPYVPFKTFLNFLDNLRQGVPQQIDRSIAPFKSMSGALQGQVKLALEYLKLITDSGETTDRLKHLVFAEEGIKREEALKDVLIPAYSFIFENGIDIESATHRQLEELFKEEGATGDTPRKCIAFFLNAAKNAGIKLSPHFKKVRGPRKGSAKPKRQPQAKAPPSIQPAKEPAPIPKAPEPTDDSSMKFITELMPKFNPEWSKEAQENWLQAINKLMDSFQKRSGN